MVHSASEESVPITKDGGEKKPDWPKLVINFDRIGTSQNRESNEAKILVRSIQLRGANDTSALDRALYCVQADGCGGEPATRKCDADYHSIMGTNSSHLLNDS
eukprot:scaffold57176_cov43-Prasinocladus_malaysianus.AAC.3